MGTMNASLSSQMSGLVAGKGYGVNGQLLEQDVHIEAHFPNVTSSNEIEEALNNLVNAASQRIHSK